MAGPGTPAAWFEMITKTGATRLFHKIMPRLIRRRKNGKDRKYTLVRGRHNPSERKSQMNEELKVGDVVELKSGSPYLTITRIEDTVTCVWFFGPIRYEGLFAHDALKYVK